MMKKIMEYFGRGRRAEGSFEGTGKEVEYRYIYMMQDGGIAVYAVCAG
jgi:hypothetical protein